MDEEAMEILHMVEQGRVSAEQGSKLLEALRTPALARPDAAGPRARFVRVAVHIAEQGGEKVAVNVNLPVALADMVLKLAQGTKIQSGEQTIMLGDYLSKMSGVDLATILHMVKEGAQGKLVDVNVQDGEDQVKVEVTVD